MFVSKSVVSWLQKYLKICPKIDSSGNQSAQIRMSTNKSLKRKASENVRDDEVLKNPVLVAEQEIARSTLHGYQLDKETVGKNMDCIADMQKTVKIGVLQCDYHYKPMRGDVADRSTYGRYNVEFVKVEGWTFEAAQAGLSGENKQDWPSSEFLYTGCLEGLSDEKKKEKLKNQEYWRTNWKNHGPGFDARQGYVRQMQKGKSEDSLFDVKDYERGDVRMYPGNVVKDNFRKAIKQLTDMGVHAITADVGYSMQFQDEACQMTHLPVGLSSLQQLSVIVALYGKEAMHNANQKILVLTVDAIPFNKNITSLLPSDVDGDLVEVFGLQHTSFGEWIETGKSFEQICSPKRIPADKCSENGGANVKDAMADILLEVKKKIKEMGNKGTKVVCILSECTELPPYSNALRCATVENNSQNLIRKYNIY